MHGTIMTNQHEKATRFRTLHEAPGVFVIANAWDGGSARILTGLGFRALATSSGACAATLGRVDGKVTRDEALAHARNIVCEALSKPVNFMVAIKGKSFSVAELAAAGVRRISLATSLYRTAMSGLVTAAREVKDAGTFAFLDSVLTTPDLNRFLQS
jgi:2-methylisocitrate lyase-like PEP mutase family enzyme